MFPRSDGKVSFMSSGDAQRQGYSLVTSAQRAVLRCQYKQQQAEVLEVGGPPRTLFCNGPDDVDQVSPCCCSALLR